MTVENQLKNDLLRYPSLMPNKWACFHEWFIVSGNETKWENGELIIEVDDKKPMLDVEEAFDLAFDNFAQQEDENIREYTNKIFDACGFESYAVDAMMDYVNYIPLEIETLKNKIKSILNIEDRINDFTSVGKMLPMCPNCTLMNLPEHGVNDDWKNACKQMYMWIKNHLDELDEITKDNFNKIKTSWLIN